MPERYASNAKATEAFPEFLNVKALPPNRFWGAPSDCIKVALSGAVGMGRRVEMPRAMEAFHLSAAWSVLSNFKCGL